MQEVEGGLPPGCRYADGRMDIECDEDDDDEYEYEYIYRNRELRPERFRDNLGPDDRPLEPSLPPNKPIMQEVIGGLPPGCRYGTHKNVLCGDQKDWPNGAPEGFAEGRHYDDYYEDPWYSYNMEPDIDYYDPYYDYYYNLPYYDDPAYAYDYYDMMPYRDMMPFDPPMQSRI